MLVEDLEVGLDPGSVDLGDTRIAVLRVSGRGVGAEPMHTQRQRECVFAQRPDFRVGANGLERGIQLSRVYAVSALLRTDLAGEYDLGQHGVTDFAFAFD